MQQIVQLANDYMNTITTIVLASAAINSMLCKMMWLLLIV